MPELNFDKTIDDFNLIVSNMNKAHLFNNTAFRGICKELFQKSYGKLEYQKNLDAGAKMLGVGIASLIKMANNQYKKDFFSKSVQKIDRQNKILSHSDMQTLYSILDNSEFFLVTKLAKIHHKGNLSEVICWVRSCD